MSVWSERYLYPAVPLWGDNEASHHQILHPEKLFSCLSFSNTSCFVFSAWAFMCLPACGNSRLYLCLVFTCWVNLCHWGVNGGRTSEWKLSSVGRLLSHPIMSPLLTSELIWAPDNRHVFLDDASLTSSRRAAFTGTRRQFFPQVFGGQIDIWGLERIRGNLALPHPQNVSADELKYQKACV